MASRILGRLEELGLIRRAQNADDLRAVKVEITDQGRIVSKQIQDSQSMIVADRLDELTDDEQNAIARAIPALEALSASLFARRK